MTDLIPFAGTPDFTTFNTWGVEEWKAAFKWIRTNEADALHWLALLVKLHGESEKPHDD